jgi:hypothetical protein
MIASISPILYQPNENLPQQYVGVVPFNEEVVQYDEEREGFQEEEYISEDTMKYSFIYLVFFARLYFQGNTPSQPPTI